MPVDGFKPGYTPATPRELPKGLKQSNSMLTVMENSARMFDLVIAPLP
jgi:hypothetical protein